MVKCAGLHLSMSNSFSSASTVDILVMGRGRVAVKGKMLQGLAYPRDSLGNGCEHQVCEDQLKIRGLGGREQLPVTGISQIDKYRGQSLEEEGVEKHQGDGIGEAVEVAKGEVDSVPDTRVLKVTTTEGRVESNNEGDQSK